MGPAHSFRFTREQRLLKSQEFASVRKRGRRVGTDLFILQVSAAERGVSRLGLVVSKRVGPAVLRNRAKRVLREVFRKNQAGFHPPLDIVVIVKSGDTFPAYEDYERDLLHGISRYYSRGRGAD